MVAEAVEGGKAPFIGGDAPSAADLNVFGILRSIESFTTEKFMFERAPARCGDKLLGMDEGGHSRSSY